MRDSVKVVDLEHCQLRQDGSSRTFSGYGSVFGVLDSYGDIVAKGAFAASLKKRRPKMLWQHDPTMPIGVWEEVREDAIGLFMRGRLAETAEGDRAYELLKMDALAGLSIGFRTIKSSFDEATGIRTLTEVELWEVSLVTFPANEVAVVSAVKHDETLSVRADLAFIKWQLLRRRAEQCLMAASSHAAFDAFIRTRVAAIDLLSRFER